MKKRFAIVLALLMALTLAACGDQNDDPNDVVGGDWRVTGVVRDSGSITRNKLCTKAKIYLCSDIIFIAKDL